MRDIYEQICRDRFIAKEAYTDECLGTVSRCFVGNGHVSTKKKFWEGNLPNWYDRVVEIRIRRDELPEVFFLTENSLGERCYRLMTGG